MSQENVTQGFQLLEKSISLMQSSLNSTFFDAYLETGENLLEGNQVRIIDGQPKEEVVKELETYYQDFSQLDLTSDETRKITQLVLLNGLKKEPIQPNHQLTPDALGFLFAYLAERLLTAKKSQSITINDLSVGTGNLMYTVAQHLKQAGFNVTGTGVDVDDILLAIASVNSGLIKTEMTLYHQDSIQNLLIDPADLTFSDLPVGFYPQDEQVKEFIVGVTNEHTYAHHLLMEQSMNYVKPEGYGIFLVPEDFLVSEQSNALKKWLNEKVYLQVVLGLPDTLFQSVSSRKSIIVVQNRSGDSKQAKEVLLAKIPSLKNAKAMQEFFEEFKNWQEKNI